MSWSSDVIAHLCDLKRQGVEFEAAWRASLEAHPPSMRDRYGDAAPTSLFEEPAESPVEFLRRVCGDAWHDRRPALRHFSGLMLLDAGSERSAWKRMRA